MYVCIYLSIYLYIYLSIYLCLFMYVCMYLCISLSINLSAQSIAAVECTDCISASGLKLPPQRVSWYDTKQSDGVVSVMLEFWGMQGTSSLQLLSGPL